MNLKTILASLIVVVHVALYVYYFSHPEGWSYNNPYTAYLTFFGIPLVLIGINMFIAMLNDCPLCRLVIAFHSTFIISLGVLFSLYYAEIIHHTNSQKLYSICTAVFLIFVGILITAFRNGHFRK